MQMRKNANNDVGMNLPIADVVKTSEKPKAATVTQPSNTKRSLESPDNSVPLCSTEDRKFHDQ